MAARVLGVSVLVFSVLTSAGCATQAPSALDPSLSASLLEAVSPPLQRDLDKLLAMIEPHPGEAPFEQIRWLPGLWEGRVEAASVGRPIVAFLMSGHPMGCT